MGISFNASCYWLITELDTVWPVEQTVSIEEPALVYCQELNAHWYHNNKPMDRTDKIFVGRVVIIPMVIVESMGHYSCFKSTEVGKQLMGSSLLKVNSKTFVLMCLHS